MTISQDPPTSKDPNQNYHLQQQLSQQPFDAKLLAEVKLISKT